MKRTFNNMISKQEFKTKRIKNFLQKWWIQLYFIETAPYPMLLKSSIIIIKSTFLLKVIAPIPSISHAGPNQVSMSMSSP